MQKLKGKCMHVIQFFASVHFNVGFHAYLSGLLRKITKPWWKVRFISGSAPSDLSIPDSSMMEGVVSRNLIFFFYFLIYIYLLRNNGNDNDYWKWYIIETMKVECCLPFLPLILWISAKKIRVGIVIVLVIKYYIYCIWHYIWYKKCSLMVGVKSVNQSIWTNFF